MENIIGLVLLAIVPAMVLLAIIGYMHAERKKRTIIYEVRKPEDLRNISISLDGFWDNQDYDFVSIEKKK